MIIRRDGTSQLLITQPDHATLAGTIMRAWTADGLTESPRRADILLAVAEHDNGWAEIDAQPIVDTAGGILDFIHAPEDARQSVWPRGAQRMAQRPYAAALIAQHAIHVYRRFRPDASWAAFFSDMEQARDSYLAASGAATLDDLLRDYFFVRVGDLASLAFCNKWTDQQVDDSSSRYTVQLHGHRLVIEPDPFNGREVPLEISARPLPARAFASADEAAALFAAAPRVSITGVASGAG